MAAAEQDKLRESRNQKIFSEDSLPESPLLCPNDLSRFSVPVALASFLKIFFKCREFFRRLF